MSKVHLCRRYVFLLIINFTGLRSYLVLHCPFQRGLPELIASTNNLLHFSWNEDTKPVFKIKPAFLTADIEVYIKLIQYHPLVVYVTIDLSWQVIRPVQHGSQQFSTKQHILVPHKINRCPITFSCTFYASNFRTPQPIQRAHSIDLERSLNSLSK